MPPLAEAVSLDPVARRLLRADRRRIVIVGAGGWIGRVLLAGLFDALGEAEARARIVCFGSSQRSVDFGQGRRIAQQPLASIGQLAAAPSMVFHLAFLTKDKVAGMSEADYVAANKALSAAVYDALECIGADRLFLASSGAAAYAADENAAHDLRLYGRLKAEDEELFARWGASAPGRRAAICRVFSVSGPFINKHDTYALASFILDSLSGRPVEVRAPAPVMRSYVALRELLSLALAELLADEGDNVARFDSGGEVLELADVAAAVATRLGGTVKRAAITRDDANCYAGDGIAYARRLARHGIAPVPLTQQVAETAVTLADVIQ